MAEGGQLGVPKVTFETGRHGADQAMVALARRPKLLRARRMVKRLHLALAVARPFACVRTVLAAAAAAPAPDRIFAHRRLRRLVNVRQAAIHLGIPAAREISQREQKCEMKKKREINRLQSMDPKRHHPKK